MSITLYTPHTTARLYAIDWLRVLSVLALFFFHVAYIFIVEVESTIRNAQTSVALSAFVFFVHQWAIPLLFLLAGTSNWFSLRKRSSGAYLDERLQRLLIPLLFGSVVLIPWIGYMTALNHASFEGPYWRWIPVHFERTWESLKTPQLHHGPIALYYTSWHLWFLGYLLIFSAVTLGSLRGAARITWLAELCERRVGLLALGLPIAGIRLALGAAFPAYLDWSDTVVYFTLFIYGWLFMTDARFLRAVERDALLWLPVGCASYALILGTYALGYLPQWLAHPGYTPDYLLYQLLLAVTTWSWVLAVLGCGLRWLNVDNAVLHYAGSAVLPFYILHQVAIATIGTVVVEWSAGVAVKFLVISGAAFVATMLTYELVVRRIRLLRVLFGLKGEASPGTNSRPAESTHESAIPSRTPQIRLQDL